MSKRDKDKALRAVVRERGIESSAAVDAETWAWWQAGKDHQLDLETGERLAAELDVDLPEINVDDFRRVGGALAVGVLDPQDELAAVLAGVRPAEQRRTGPAHVQVAGRARREAGSNDRRLAHRMRMIVL